MREIPAIQSRSKSQHGAALLIALLMLVVLLMLGIAAVHIGLQSERISRNWRDRQIAWQAAEAALLDAEYDIGNPHSPRHALFDNMPSIPAASGGNQNAPILPGLYFPAADPQAPRWRRLTSDHDASGLDYGRFTARTMQTGIGALPARAPRYLLEILPRLRNQPANDRSRRYRISALGFGPDPDTRVMLQSIYRRQPASANPAGAAPDAPSMRIGWRELAIPDTE
ncbi:pilus assembly protein [Oxalobacteraceae bacterium CAVE-383]|nr:pilus assembly protein [Oxalobacteraceae bacterium CAVE-383]